MTAVKIYLAGPEVFLPDAAAAGAALKALCARHGAEGLFPSDNEIPGLAEPGADAAGLIRSANMALIASSDAVVASMVPFRGPSTDVGTAYEMGVAAALGKVVVGYGAGVKCYADKVAEARVLTRHADERLRDEEGMAVEEFFDGEGDEKRGLVDNLMLARGVDGQCATAEEAIVAAVEIFRKRGSSADGA